MLPFLYPGDWLVLMHWMAVGNHVDTFSGREYIQDIRNYNYTDIGKPRFIKDGIKNITFQDKINYQSSVVYEYSLNFQILGYNLYYSSANKTAYNNWKFEKGSDFDAFYYD